jgi:hypothetical protein
LRSNNFVLRVGFWDGPRLNSLYEQGSPSQLSSASKLVLDPTFRMKPEQSYSKRSKRLELSFSKKTAAAPESGSANHGILNANSRSSRDWKMIIDWVAR